MNKDDKYTKRLWNAAKWIMEQIDDPHEGGRDFAEASRNLRDVVEEKKSWSREYNEYD